jgi:hypothetical protein
MRRGVDKPKRDEAQRTREDMLRETDRIRADAQKDVESARRAHFPERRRRDRRAGVTEISTPPNRRLGDRRQ